MKSSVILSLILLLALSGCDQKAMFEKFVPKKEADFAKNYIALLQARDFDSVLKKMSPELNNPQAQSKLKEMAEVFPNDKPVNIQAVGVQTNHQAGKNQINLTFQYEFPGKFLLANVVLEKKQEDIIVIGANIYPLQNSLEYINRFTFEGKGLVNYIVFILAIIVPLFIATAIVLCVKTPIPNRKWLWILFILVGFVELKLNWSDGNFNVLPLSLKLFGAGFFKPGPYSPILLSVSFPLGAIVFLLKRKKWLRQI